MKPLLAALALAVMLPAAASEVVFRVDEAGNLDLDAARLQQLLADPRVEVSAHYAPLIAIPGWTGRFGLCRGPSICLKKRWRPLRVKKSDVQRAPDHLQFRVAPWRWSRLMPHRVAGPLRVSLPPFWPGDLPVNLDSDLLLLAADPDRYPAREMHLAVPYAGLASWHGAAEVTRAGRLPDVVPCDPAVQVAADGRPQLRAHRRAAAYVSWLQQLADSDWWATQIEGVQLRASAAPAEAATTDAPRWREVQVARGGVRLRHLRIEQPVLLSSACPGSSRLDISWLDDRLLAVQLQDMPEVFSEVAGCEDAATRTEEALWWQGELQRHARASGWRQQLWEAWRQPLAECRDEPALQAAPSTQRLEALVHRYASLPEAAERPAHGADERPGRR